jgi:hypothetical protein
MKRAKSEGRRTKRKKGLKEELSALSAQVRRQKEKVVEQ